MNHRRCYLSSLALGLLTASVPAMSEESSTWADVLGAEIINDWRAIEHRAFDFWIGEWEMNWRPPADGQLRHQPEGSWTRQRVFPILGGKALIELAWARDNPHPPSQRGFSIRYYDPARERWVMAQNWPNATNTGTAFLDQLIGDAHHGRLTMYSITTRPDSDGNPRTEHRRYNFSDIRPGIGFRWDGSNTADFGATWYTWYVVDAYRKGDLDPFRPLVRLFPAFTARRCATKLRMEHSTGCRASGKVRRGMWAAFRQERRLRPAFSSTAAVLQAYSIQSLSKRS